MTMNPNAVKVTTRKWMRDYPVRRWVAIKLIWLAAVVLGFALEVEEK